MQTGTAVGLLVGGAVLLLAVSKPRAVVPGQPTNYPGGNLNPFNWFGQQAQPSYATPAAPLLAAPQGAFQFPANQGGYQYANYNSPGFSPAMSPAVASGGGYSPYLFNAGYSPYFGGGGGAQALSYVPPSWSNTSPAYTAQPAAQSVGYWV